MAGLLFLTFSNKAFISSISMNAISDNEKEKIITLHSEAHDLIRTVLPVPGGPYIRSLLGTVRSFGNLSGIIILSIKAFLVFYNPIMLSHHILGLSIMIYLIIENS